MNYVYVAAPLGIRGPCDENNLEEKKRKKKHDSDEQQMGEVIHH